MSMNSNVAHCTESRITGWAGTIKTTFRNVFLSSETELKAEDCLVEHWQSKVRQPSITASDIHKQFSSWVKQGETFYGTYFGSGKTKSWSETCKVTPQFIKDGFNLVISGYKSIIQSPSKLAYEKKYGAVPYLPTETRQALNAYWQTPGYWFNRFWNPQKVQLEEILLKGPVAIKQVQSEVNAFGPQKEKHIQGMLTRINELEELPDFLKRIFKYLPQKQLAELEAKKALLTEVPGAVGKQFDTPKRALIEAYNTQNSSDKIKEETAKAVKAGSIGQVFEAETETGKKVILKVIKPGIDDAFLGAHKQYLYFQGLLEQGVDAKAKTTAIRNSEATVRLLQEEIHPVMESENTKKLAAWTTKNTPKLNVPEILANTQQGLVMHYVGEEDLSNLSLEEQNTVKRQIGEDITRVFALSPHKPMDLHAGNVRVGPKLNNRSREVALIDHGRQANLNTAMNEDLLKLMARVFYSQTENPDVLRDPAVRTQLKALLLHNQDGNQVYLNNLAKIDTITKESQLNPGQEAAHEELQRLLEKLFTRTIPERNEISPKGLVRKIPERKMLTVLSAWSNAAQVLPGFSKQPISKEDIKTCLDNTKALLEPYFDNNGGARLYGDASEMLATELLEKLGTQPASNSFKENLGWSLNSALKADIDDMIAFYHKPFFLEAI